VLAEAQRLLDSIGAEGYAERWVEHPFPLASLEQLRQAIYETTSA
jgi:hypothetical protein